MGYKGRLLLSEPIRKTGLMRSIPIDVLRAFVAVVEARGFTRAAEALGRTQPTISLQVKRLEELIEAPLFQASSRLEMTAVGGVCFEYGKRLLRLHDDMLDEAIRQKSPGARIRVGIAAGFSAALTPNIVTLSQSEAGAGLEISTDGSTQLAAAFRDNTLDVAIVVADDKDASARWRAAVGWFGGSPRRRDAPLTLVLPPADSPVHEAAVAALRAHDIRFEVACVSADFAALTAAARAGIGVAPILEALAPSELKRAQDRTLPPLPAVTVSLLSHSAPLAAAGRRWISESLPKLAPA